MSILDSFLNGIFFSLGFFITLFFFTLFIIRGLSGKKKTTYKTDELLPAFKSYLSIIKEKEKYEEIIDVEKIIDELIKGKVPDNLDKYNIKKDNSLIIKQNEGSGSEIAFVNKYKVIGIKSK